MKTISTLLCIFILSNLSQSETHANPRSLLLDENGVSLNIKLMKMPNFPNSLVDEGYYEGDVKLAMDIDQDGELRDWIVLESTHPAFVDSVERVISSWRFSAPYINGENRSVVNYLNIHFESKNNVVSFVLPTSVQNRLFNQATGFGAETNRISRIKELDAKPYIVDQPSPQIPEEVIKKHNGTRAVFTFYIDEAGRVRIPALAQTDGDPEPGMILAAQDALTQWKFEPPTKNKRPATVKLSQTFVFKNK